MRSFQGGMFKYSNLMRQNAERLSTIRLLPPAHRVIQASRRPVPSSRFFVLVLNDIPSIQAGYEDDDDIQRRLRTSRSRNALESISLVHQRGSAFRQASRSSIRIYRIYSLLAPNGDFLPETRILRPPNPRSSSLATLALTFLASAATRHDSPDMDASHYTLVFHRSLARA